MSALPQCDRISQVRLDCSGGGREPSRSLAYSKRLVEALKECGKNQDLERGKELHSDAVAANLHSTSHVASALIKMYSKCRDMGLAKQAFDGMSRQTVFTWNALLLGYVQNSEASAAMDLYSVMDCEPDEATYVAVLKACGALAAEKNSEKQVWLNKGIAIHQRLKGAGFDCHNYVANSLVGMYGKCGSMQNAKAVFDSMYFKDVVTWNSLILAYVENGQSSVAMDLFASMDCEPDRVAFLAILKACSTLATEEESQKQFCLNKGIAIHEQVTNLGLSSDLTLANTLIDMYSKCGSMDRAKRVFDSIIRKSVVSWNALIMGYVENKQCSVALDLFSSMDCSPDIITYLAALKACGGLATEDESAKQLCLEKGLMIHQEVKKRGYDSKNVVATVLLDMYSKCGSMERASEIFSGMVYKDVVSWNSLILGYVQNEEHLSALTFFTKMECEPTCITYVAVLKACGNLAALPAGRQIHARVCQLGLEQEEIIASTLIVFYGKCGMMHLAEELFNNIQSPDRVSWTTLIGGYGIAGDPYQVFGLAKQLLEAGIEMNPNLFLCILVACSHAGLVEEGKLYFQYMQEHGLSPTVEHYTCMVDMLGRANKLEEALSMVRSMPWEADVVTWCSLLGACKKWNNLEVGKVAFDGFVDVDRTNSAAYVLMSAIYAKWNMWEDLEHLEDLKKKTVQAVEEGPGLSDGNESIVVEKNLLQHLLE